MPLDKSNADGDISEQKSASSVYSCDTQGEEHRGKPEETESKLVDRVSSDDGM